MPALLVGEGPMPWGVWPGGRAGFWPPFAVLLELSVRVPVDPAAADCEPEDAPFCWAFGWPCAFCPFCAAF